MFSKFKTLTHCVILNFSGIVRSLLLCIIMHVYVIIEVFVVCHSNVFFLHIFLQNSIFWNCTILHFARHLYYMCTFLKYFSFLFYFIVPSYPTYNTYLCTECTVQHTYYTRSICIFVPHAIATQSGSVDDHIN